MRSRASLNPTSAQRLQVRILLEKRGMGGLDVGFGAFRRGSAFSRSRLRRPRKGSAGSRFADPSHTSFFLRKTGFFPHLFCSAQRGIRIA